jgi:hypothetical protein
VAETAAANGIRTIEMRLARWLLMCQDRVGTAELSITHDFLSIMLGVQRPGVTLALHTLEGAHMIRNKRGRIVVLDRAKLQQVAGDSYGVPEAEFDRLFQATVSAVDEYPRLQRTI